MKEQLRRLVRLQEVDVRIHQLKKEKAKIPGMVEAAKGVFNQCKQEMEEARKRLDGLEKDKRAKDVRLKDDTALLERLKGRLAEIKTNKEYFAHLKEVETVEKDIKGLEDEILGLMEQIETATKVVGESDDRFREEEGRLAEQTKEIEESFAAVDRELAELDSQRKEQAASVSSDIFRAYDRLVAQTSGLAVVEAVNYSCMGCHMNLPPQVFNNVRLNESLITCDYCHRILYWREGLFDDRP